MDRLTVLKKAEGISRQAVHWHSALTDARLAGLIERHGDVESIVAAYLALEFLQEAAEGLEEDIDDGEYGTEGD